jgi:MFS family permease
MAEENLGQIQKRIRSPRSAALAGIIFSGLLVASMLLITGGLQVPVEEINPEWLERRVDTVSLGLSLIPFAGIAFFWFTGVIRDHIGEREDRFFATVFLGSGIAFVVLMFVYAAILGAVFGTYTFAADLLTDNDIYIFGFMLINEIIGNYTLRIAGVYMLSIGTIWTRTEVTPRWLTIITYLLALIFLFFAGSIREARFIFPAWVFLTSVFILITNRRLERVEEST